MDGTTRIKQLLLTYLQTSIYLTTIPDDNDAGALVNFTDVSKLSKKSRIISIIHKPGSYEGDIFVGIGQYPNMK